MGKFVFAPQALDDLDLVWVYIARDNPDAADRVIESAFRICEILADHPELGRLRRFPENNPADVRWFVITDFPNYLIFYRVKPDGVEILRVVQGAQDMDALFGE